MPKYLNELFSDEDSRLDKEEITKWLYEWILEFKKRAEGRTGTVRYCNFKTKEIFFYTDCQDLEQQVQDRKITQSECDNMERQRKREVYVQLFLKELIYGQPIVFKQKCTHCGKENVELSGLGLSGTVLFCPDCNRTTIDTFVPDMLNAYKILRQKLIERGVIKDE